jgi:hypothetical protein
MPLPELTDDDKAILAELLRETIRARPLPAVAERAELQGDPGEARPAGTRYPIGTNTGSEAAGRAQAAAVERATNRYPQRRNARG